MFLKIITNLVSLLDMSIHGEMDKYNIFYIHIFSISSLLVLECCNFQENHLLFYLNYQIYWRKVIVFTRLVNSGRAKQPKSSELMSSLLLSYHGPQMKT